MNKVLIDNTNNVVKPNDTLYILGDFCFSNPDRFLGSIKCQNILMLPGNHDKKAIKKVTDPRVTVFLDRIQDINFNGIKVTLCHWPMRSWNCSFHGAFHLHGHSHSLIRNPHNDPKYSMDIGIDCSGYKPVSWDEVCKYMLNFKI